MLFKNIPESLQEYTGLIQKSLKYFYTKRNDLWSNLPFLKIFLSLFRCRIFLSARLCCICYLNLAYHGVDARYCRSESSSENMSTGGARQSRESGVEQVRVDQGRVEHVRASGESRAEKGRKCQVRAEEGRLEQGFYYCSFFLPSERLVPRLFY